MIQEQLQARNRLVYLNIIRSYTLALSSDHHPGLAETVQQGTTLPAKILSRFLQLIFFSPILFGCIHGRFLLIIPFALEILGGWWKALAFERVVLILLMIIALDWLSGLLHLFTTLG